MATYAYLRVSTDQQDVDNQRHGILEYANQHNITGLKFYEDNKSGAIKWQNRKLGDLLLKIAEDGDTILFAEISRMGRSTLQVLEVLEHSLRRKLVVHVVKQKIVLDDSLNALIFATVFGLSAQIDRELISQRTKEALARCKAEGMILGRRKGSTAKKLMLDKHAKDINHYLEIGLSKRSICKLLKCAPSTLYEWIDRRKIAT